jgi:hypothetical protein
MDSPAEDLTFSRIETPDLVRHRSSFFDGEANRYVELDAAICKYFFRPEKAGIPVYLDVEEEELAECGESIGLTGDDFRESLVQSVMELLVLGKHGVSVFKEFERANSRWRRLLAATRTERGARLLPPPVVGLLAVLVIPAEQMGSEGGQGGSHQKYYPRLEELLSISPEDSARFKKGFRESSEEFWQSLNLWLESEDGNFGLPTAYSLSHRYVGLPVSQALIRETERRQLRRFFAQTGLSPSDQITGGEMEELLEQWIGRSDSPATKQLKQLWANGENREQLSEIAVNELHSWDGFGFDQFRQGGRAFSGSRQCFLYLSERRESLFRSALRFGILAKAGLEIIDREVGLKVPPDSIPLTPFQLRDGLVGFDTGSTELDALSLLEGVVEVQLDEADRKRLPRSFVPFEFDPIANIWIETVSMEVGGEYRCLVAESELEALRPVLDQIAADGYSKMDKPGIPAGWILLDEVAVIQGASDEILGTQDFQLSAFRARPSNKISFLGGLKLPGRVTRFSSLDIPTISVAHDQIERSSILVRRLDLEKAEDIHRTDYRRGPYVIELQEFLTNEGDYELLLLEDRGDGNAVPVTRATLRLRSSQEPDPTGWSSFADVAHLAEDPLWVMRASIPNDDSATLVNGALSFGPESSVLGQEATLITRAQPETFASTPDHLVRLSRLDPESCAITSRHRWRLPMFDGTYQRGFITQTCDWCGLEQKVPANAKLAAHISNQRRLARAHPSLDSKASVEAQSVLRVAHKSLPASVRAAEDAVFYLGRGTISHLNQIAHQVESGALFASRFSRNLELLAAIEIVREGDLSAIEFEVAPAVAGTVSTGEVVFFGSWLPSHRQEVIDLGQTLGISVTEYQSQGHTLMQLEELGIEELRGHLGKEYEYQERPGLELIRRLPGLSTVADGLTRIPFTKTPDLQKFNVEAGIWEKADQPGDAEGAFLAARHNRRYLVRTAKDVELNQAALADPYVSKHVAALQARRRLVDFDQASSQLRVPLGCDLPGLYGRAAVLEGGLLPIANRGILVYEAISEDFAEELLDKLSA